MFDVILAMTKSGGVGNSGSLPWRCEEELKLFQNKTIGNVLITGRKTAESLPVLNDRTIIALSTKDPDIVRKKCKTDITDVFPCLESVLCEWGDKDEKIFIIGGAEVYNEVFKRWRCCIKKVHLSIMDDEYECDKIVNFDYRDWTVEERIKYNDFTHYVLFPKTSEEKEYLTVLKNVYTEGCIKEGRNGKTKSLFGQNLKFDLTNGFPLLTTKKMFFRGIVEELLFFLRGQTDSTLLEDKNINIWKGNTNRKFLDSIGKIERREGIMGPMYGYQWRNYNAPYDEKTGLPKQLGLGRPVGLDQLADVVYKIRNDPHSRRILLTDFNPLQANDGVLFPCHSIIIQFYVSSDNKYLDMFCYNRSSDLFHGLPFNIASSALLQTFIAKITGKIARKFVLSLGDAHIYEPHYSVVVKQLERIPYQFPKLVINKELNNIQDIENLSYGDISVKDYSSYPTLKAPMIS